MIHVEKPAQTPAGLHGNTYEKWVEKALDEKATHSASTGLYRHATVKDVLWPLYHNKCGYCETPEGPGSVLRIDHYRPKGGVTEAEGHPGYYWLAYEWTNLVPSCETCNSQAHKGNHFPIANEQHRIAHPPAERANWAATCNTMANEAPLLLHPEIDRPEHHIGFLPNGSPKPINNSEKGSISIKIYGLDREKLVLARKALVDDALMRIKKALLQCLSGQTPEDTCYHSLKNEFDTLRKARRPQNAYSLFGYYMWRYFPQFFINGLAPKQKALLTKLYKQYQEEKAQKP